MNKKLVAVIMSIVILGGAGFAAMSINSNNDNKSNESTSQSGERSNITDEPARTDTSQTNETSNSTSKSNSTADVEIKNTDYTQKKITVKVGTKVTWTNKDSMRHDVVPAEDYGDAFRASELLGKNETYSFTFTKAGTYNYFCMPHPFMKATVVVTE